MRRCQQEAEQYDAYRRTHLNSCHHDHPASEPHPPYECISRHDNRTNYRNGAKGERVSPHTRNRSRLVQLLIYECEGASQKQKEKMLYNLCCSILYRSTFIEQNTTLFNIQNVNIKQQKRQDQ